RWMARHRQYKQLQSRLGVQGRIIATEINHGEANGWHPHFHELWFFEGSGVDAAQLEKDLHVLWVAACHKFGLGTPSRKHGVVVQDGSRAASYVAKMGDKPWTLADEMAKANAKKGRRSNRSFWQLIDCYMDENATTQHRNRGLKKRYSVTDMTDEELAAQQEEEAVFIADIPLPDWRIVIRHRLEAVILDVCLNGRQAVYAIIEAYRTKAPPNKRHCDEKG
ncbi:hypothetical protein, partial [Aeromonas sp. 102P]|uniref:hypothetical protein n=1 Tax=Aeromonas sp. 102P TaxID=3452711 RepID=UPI003F79DF9A